MKMNLSGLGFAHVVRFFVSIRAAFLYLVPFFLWISVFSFFSGTCISPAPVEYTVTFNSNGGSQVASKKVAAGNKVTQPEDPTFGEQNFAGWYSDEELTSLFYFDNVIINKNITLYAKWAVRTYTVTFNTGIGGLTINPVTVNRGDKVAEQKDPTGVYILVWYKDEARSEKFDFNTPITASLTLYATSTIAVTFITLNQTELLNTLIGTQTQLTATVSPENAFNKMLAWSSSNINVATVDVNGAITTHAAGTATITVSSTDGSNISASITIVPHFEIKDAEFKKVLKAIATANSYPWFTTIGTKEALNVNLPSVTGLTKLDVGSKNIASLSGVEYFVGLKVLNCQSNRLESLDVSKNVVLDTLNCQSNRLTSLDMRGLRARPGINTLSTLAVKILYDSNDNNNYLTTVHVHEDFKNHGQLQFLKLDRKANETITTYSADPGSTNYTKTCTSWDPYNKNCITQ